MNEASGSMIVHVQMKIHCVMITVFTKLKDLN